VTPTCKRLLTWIAALFGDDVTTRVFHPLIADWQHEMRLAGSGLPRLRSMLAGANALLTAALFTAATMAAPWRTSADNRRSALRTLAVFTGIGSAVLFVPFLKYLGDDRSPLLLLALLPSSLPIALAFALVPTLLHIASHASPARRAGARLDAIALVIAALVLTSLCAGWLGPLANQEWRRAISSQRPQPGVREMTLPELISADARRFGDRAVALEWRTRASAAISWPVTLALLGWRLGRRSVHVTTKTMSGWWLAAATFVAVTDPLRTVLGRDGPWLVAPLLWLLIAVVLRPRAAAIPSVGCSH
jgi:hypothetical protein